MPIDFKGLYEFHGHSCPMSTIGARLGLAAMSALGVTKADQFKIEAYYMAKNCALDGIQYVTGCTIGNGNFSYEDHGKAELSLKKRDGSRCVNVSVSEDAMSKLARHRIRRAELMEEREISGLARATEIDAEIKRDAETLVDWAQSAPDEDMLEMMGCAI